MAEDFISGRKTASCLDVSCGQLGGKVVYVVMKSSENLLAMRMADRNRPHAGADHSQGCLVQINRHGLFRFGFGCCQCTKHDRMVPPSRVLSLAKRGHSAR